ncbi:hypothetical protein BCR33DRAFT_523788 [Rhizoclosmatium globosum]|uniref:Uncharacterized protein n=1 Tax=Rhizoclosmatium globosum TaxID=329046 RepID=A0A1Y2BE03_9FUNG|nr:hypothetical protein BCR33DRAFT_523788 [Rhizoclosmatium globosum]|eukprot:ORY32994.1 hypothetical protein BCR33DRAFT_523788 [Rhizoclosmatium globosum]
MFCQVQTWRFLVYGFSGRRIMAPQRTSTIHEKHLQLLLLLLIFPWDVESGVTRSEELLRKRWSRRVLSVLRMQLNLFPIAIIAPPLKLVIPGSVSNSVKTIIFISLFSLQCMIVCTMDGIMAMTFVLHIRNMKQDSTLVSPKLTVIANYGLTACVFVFLIVGCLEPVWSVG